ncbi:hypothetical protein H2200_003054 [Cladophialophora chaetospira]|uniref:Heterokaryon incompatibility domain-containing protein n=1 Tax=Cladophialophora chaetospira TaxID=386627 RepID=A0AA39CMD5_9EURO|nr:hypothetical protein H2200_003054 [Cladophialophora chaetospira]
MRKLCRKLTRKQRILPKPDHSIVDTVPPQPDEEERAIDNKPSLREIYPSCLFEALDHACIKERVHNLCEVCSPVFSNLLDAYEDHPLYDPDQPEKVRREVDSWDWSWTLGCGTKQVQAYESEQGYTCNTQSLRQICVSALGGCDGCGLVLDGIAKSNNATRLSHYQGRTVAPDDQIKVHLHRWKTNDSRVLDIIHYGKVGSAFDGSVHLSMAAERRSSSARYVSGRVDFGGTESSGTLGLAKEWLDECMTSKTHAECASEDRKLPSRVLDVREGLRLDKTSNRFGKYATLSYCWGGEQPGKLLTTNRTAYLANIVEAEQPKTIRDAIRVTRALGLSFLWIDSYCIIQDSQEDKATEIRKMAQIFQDSTITIAAACSPSVGSGFLKSESNLKVMPLHLTLPDGTLGEIWLQRSFLGSHHSLEPINRRAWTLQEQALSRRLLFFPSKTRDIEFQCESSGRHSMNAVASRGGGVNLSVAGGHGTLSLPRNIYVEAGEEYFNESQNLLLWKIVVGRYTRRALTEPNDKLLALAGIASQFAPTLGPTYLAGLWETRLVFQLLWFTCTAVPVNASVQRPESYTGPSWSWSSLTGLMSAFSSDSAFEEGSRKQDRLDSLRLRILGHRVELADKDNVFGAVNYAEITVHGWLMYATVTQSMAHLSPSKVNMAFEEELELEPLELWEHGPRKISYKEPIGSAVLDIRSEYPLKAKVYCLIVNRVYYRGWGIFKRIKNQNRHTRTHYVQGGLLLATDSTSKARHNRFRRIGVFHIDPDYDHRFIDSAQKQTIVLL